MGFRKPKDIEEKKEEKSVKIEKPQVEKRLVVRVAGTDLDGEKPVINAIKGIQGISHSMAKAICQVGGFDPNLKLGLFDEKSIEKLEQIIKNPESFGIPDYLLNRRKDIETGKNLHLTSSDLVVARKFDIKKQIDMKSYRGWRHMLGQPVRGQRTRSHFRGGGVVGVMRKAIKLQLQKKEEEEKK